MPLSSSPHLHDFNRVLFRKFGVLLLLLGLSACSGTYHDPNKSYDLSASYDQQVASRLFSQGFEHVTEFYIEEIDASRLALAAMDNLATIDPEIEIIDHGDSLTLNYAGEPVSRHGYPSTLSSYAWARLTASVITEARTLSSDFNHASGEQIYQAAFDGIAGELDRFSRYSRPDIARTDRDNRNGFFGLGIRYLKVPKGARVLSVMENTPAESAGLEKEDIITQVNNRDISQLTETVITGLMKGPENSRVGLTVQRNQKNPITLQFEITRKKITVQTVSSSIHDNIVYLHISSFNKYTTSNMRSKVRKAQKELGENLKGYIIDLRDNGGGLLGTAIKTADLFISSGTIITTRGRHPDSQNDSSADSQDIAKGLPIIVLINSNSASSSEILTAGLQDSGRAIVIGSNSFGKGTVQRLKDLPNGAEMRVTWARFHAPSGYAIHKRGIIPDICTTMGNAQTVEDIISLLKSGILPIADDVRSASPALDDEIALDNIKATCPQSNTTSELEKDIAEYLLASPALFDLAKGRTTPTTSQVTN
ncbi:S41 family peptidase [Kiloniella antarctica]|uniref:S41 family peptidase n=1 Tax=Kiloniella antarctica TaxID=1550907 RepID=A0ABW5BSL1_9PROT